MKIATWNVNSVKVRLPHLLDYLKNAQPDVLCLQEIKCLADDFPRVERTRKLVNDGSRYFGPYASASSVDESMNLIRRLFPFRTCTIDIREGERALQRPCLLYHIKRCQGPCIEAIEKAASILCVDCVANRAGLSGISSGTSIAKRPR